MSIRLMSQVWTVEGLEPTERLLLMALADHANDAGVCWPGIPTLAVKTHISIRQVQRLLRAMQRAGFFIIENENCGRGHHKRFILNRDKLFQERVTSVSPFMPETPQKGDIQGQKGDIAMSLKGDMAEHEMSTTVKNHQENRSTSVSQLSPDIKKRTFNEIMTGSPPPGLREG